MVETRGDERNRRLNWYSWQAASTLAAIQKPLQFKLFDLAIG